MSDLIPFEEDQDAAALAVQSHASVSLAAGEVSMQLDAAHRYPRSIGRFMRAAQTLATMSEDIAAACIYSLPRAGKQITGPSVRLAEIVASAYGNLHVGARIVDVDDKEITAQGAAWDMESNLRVTVEVRRRITDRNGKRFNEDMIVVTGNAAASIALRNAIFRAVPRAYVDQVYEAARRTAVGSQQTLAAKRDKVLARLGVLGVPQARVLARVGAATIEDVGLEALEVLIGLGTALKDGGATPDEAFPPVPVPVESIPEGRRMSLRVPAEPAKATAAEPSAPAEPPPPADPAPLRPPPKTWRDLHAGDWPTPACPECVSTADVAECLRATEMGSWECRAEVHGPKALRFHRATEATRMAAEAACLAAEWTEEDLDAAGYPADSRAWAEATAAIVRDDAAVAAGAAGSQP